MSCNPRFRHGVVTRFSNTTWWGRIKLDGEERSIDFHGTCYYGMSLNHEPSVHQRVVVIFGFALKPRRLGE